MVGDYWYELGQRDYDLLTGTGTDIIEIPSGAWVTGYSLVAGVSSCTLTITRPDATTVGPITVPAGGSYSAVLVDTGRLSGAEFEFDSTASFAVELYR